MSIRPFRDIKESLQKKLKYINVLLGNNNPIVVQSMTNTLKQT